jgi:hypothetical protein
LLRTLKNVASIIIITEDSEINQRNSTTPLKGKKMSILDTLTGLISNIFSSTPSSDKESPSSESIEEQVVSAAETKSEQEPVIKAKVESKPEATPSSVSVEKVSKVKIPEDATLKRHVISILKSEIESKLPSRPTDSTLKRHYDARVQSELDNLLLTKIG